MKIAPKSLEKLSARKLVKIWEQLNAKRNLLTDEIIDAGLGYVPMQTLHKDYLHFTAVMSDKGLSDQQQMIRAECERRFGPDGLFEARYTKR